MDLNNREIERIVEQTVRSTLLTMGLNIEDPSDVLEIQKDFRSLRDWRLAQESVKSYGLLTAVGILVTGGIAAMWAGLSGYIRIG